MPAGKGTYGSKVGRPKKVKNKMGYSEGGKVKVRGTGAATKGLYARGPMA